MLLEGCLRVLRIQRSTFIASRIRNIVLKYNHMYNHLKHCYNHEILTKGLTELMYLDFLAKMF
jgi:hypothetical protein